MYKITEYDSRGDVLIEEIWTEQDVKEYCICHHIKFKPEGDEFSHSFVKRLRGAKNRIIEHDHRTFNYIPERGEIMKQIEALAGWLEVGHRKIKILDSNTFEYDSEEYLVVTEYQANKLVEENINDSLWAFNANFILHVCGWNGSRENIKALEVIQEKLCESANSFIRTMIQETVGIEEFVQEAVSADGRGHFLALYDGDENENGGYFIYRIN